MSCAQRVKMLAGLILAPFVALISLSLSPFPLVIFLINEVVRKFIYIVFLSRRYQTVKETSGNFNMCDIFNGRMVVVGLYSQDPADPIKDQNRFMERVFPKTGVKNKTQDYSELQKTYVRKHGYCWFRDDKDSFNIANHVKIFDACRPQNGDAFTEKELVNVIIPNHLSHDMDESKPQWEWLIIPRIQREDGTINSLRLFRWDHRYMDGGCVGVLLCEHLFDKWDTPYPPYVINPKLVPTKRGWSLFYEFWAWLHLPLMLLVGIFSKRSQPVQPPFSAWSNKGTKSYSIPETIDQQSVRVAMKDNDIPSFKSALASFLGPVMHGTWKQSGQKLPTEPVIVGSLQALPPFRKPLVNQYTVLHALVPVVDQVQVHEFEITLQLCFANVFQRFMGRLPIPVMNILTGPVPGTVCVNSIPLLRKTATMHGSLIQDVGSWSFLCLPVGIQISVIGYGGKLYFTATSVEKTFTQDKLQELVKNYVNSFRYHSSEQIV